MTPASILFSGGIYRQTTRMGSGGLGGRGDRKKEAWKEQKHPQYRRGKDAGGMAGIPERIAQEACRADEAKVTLDSHFKEHRIA